MKKLLSLTLLTLLLASLTLNNNANAASVLPTSPYSVDANTIALYHFDSPVGSSNAIDSVGNHNGTLHGDAQIASNGYFGNGLNLDGIGDYVRIGNINQNPYVSAANGTVELMVNLSSAPSHFVLLGSGTEYGSSWDDGFFLGRHGGYSDKLVFGLWNYGWQYAYSNVTPESLVGQWHHIAGTWGTKGTELWLDGELIATNPFNLGSNELYSTALIGSDSWTWTTPGLIDEVRFSNIQRDFPASPVPEPTTMLLGLISAIAGCFGFKRK